MPMVLRVSRKRIAAGVLFLVVAFVVLQQSFDSLSRFNLPSVSTIAGTSSTVSVAQSVPVVAEVIIDSPAVEDVVAAEAAEDSELLSTPTTTFASAVVAAPSAVAGVPVAEAGVVAEPSVAPAVTPSETTPYNNIEFLIPMTNSHFNFCRSLYTALINDYPPPKMINYGKVYETAPEARLYKIRGIADYLHSLSADKVVFIMDGYDVWYQLPYREFVDLYKDMAKSGKTTTIFGADKKCWPNDPASPACTAVPESTLPRNAYGAGTDELFRINPDRRYMSANFRPRWLNSGNMIGPVSVLGDIYSRANYSITHAGPGGIFSDQLFISEIYGQQQLPMIVDFNSTLFQTMAYSTKDLQIATAEEFAYPRHRPAGENGTYAFNKISRTLPPVLHFNCPKECMDEFWPLMWWSKQKDDPALRAKSEEVYKTGGAYVAEDNTFLSWDELCHGVDVHAPEPYVAKPLSAKQQQEQKWRQFAEAEWRKTALELQAAAAAGKH
ncbi:uncharacterized protein V1518DRAFT_434177 [Limtongia smithiae]|uniref:uncharacterized protein n=1 Tax=Limtongia smithiae TaxID=1125753 RepID=UPI0034CD03CB